MTQPPPPTGPAGSSYSIPPGPSKTNGLAVASLICAIGGFCVLFLGGLAGVILGFLGLRKARDPQVGGRGMAIAGIVIGILSLLTSCIFCYGMFFGIRAGLRASEPPRAAARQFVQDLTTGDVTSASAEVTAGLPQSELAAMSHKLQSLGAFRDMTSSQINVSNSNGAETCTLKGVAKFASGDEPYDITLLRQGSAWKVSQAQFH